MAETFDLRVVKRILGGDSGRSFPWALPSEGGLLDEDVVALALEDMLTLIIGNRCFRKTS